MIETMRDLISRAEELAKAGQYDEAMSLATDLVDRYPGEMEVWSLRAYLHGRSRNYKDAIADVTRAIEINPVEPVLFFDRGSDALAMGDDEAAVSDFTRGLELCDHYNNDYYRESLHFLRAEALVRLGKKEEALADLMYVREDLKSWTYKLRTKADLVADCHALPDKDDRLR